MDLSNNAKMLYGLILDRASLSENNGLSDKDGRIQMYLTNEQDCQILMFYLYYDRINMNQGIVKAIATQEVKA